VNDNIVATLSGSSFYGPVKSTGGFTGSHSTLSSGISFIAGGTGIQVVTASNGQIIINSLDIGSANSDPSASYLVVGVTSSLANERALTAGSGITFTDAGVGSTFTVAVSSTVARTTGATFTGPTIFSGGATGSIQQVSAGLSYIVAGDNITVTSQSNGQVVIKANLAGVGGLVLSMSATFAKEGDRFKPQILFHVGRIVSFFLLGGLIGMIGSAFTLNITGTFVLSLLVGIVMLILGINLLDVFDFAKRFQIGMPKFLSKHVIGISKLNHSLTPLLLGVATFFLPCGFTQSMQVYALSSGSFIKGGLTMLFFALGTLPVLAILSFSSSNISKSSKSGVFFKTAGLIVISFALLNIVNALVVVGFIKPFLNF
jgi:sulfite exporter TauE/SafE